MTIECDLCFSGDNTRCGCAEWVAYWDSLTPNQRREELEAMGRHVEETQIDREAW